MAVVAGSTRGRARIPSSNSNAIVEILEEGRYELFHKLELANI